MDEVWLAYSIARVWGDNSRRDNGMYMVLVQGVNRLKCATAKILCCLGVIGTHLHVCMGPEVNAKLIVQPLTTTKVNAKHFCRPKIIPMLRYTI